MTQFYLIDYYSIILLIIVQNEIDSDQKFVVAAKEITQSSIMKREKSFGCDWPMNVFIETDISLICDKS